MQHFKINAYDEPKPEPPIHKSNRYAVGTKVYFVKFIEDVSDTINVRFATC